MEKNMLRKFIKENGGEIMSFLHDMLTPVIAKATGLSKEDISRLSQTAKKVARFKRKRSE